MDTIQQIHSGLFFEILAGVLRVGSSAMVVIIWDVFDMFSFFFLLLHRPRISKIQFKGRYFMLRVRDKSVSHF
jgi:hypothetical protein